MNARAVEINEAGEVEQPTSRLPVAMRWQAPVATPAQMLASALERGAGFDVIAKFMDLNDRWEAGEKRKAFDAAVSDAKGEIPVIPKNRAGHNGKRYADMAAIAKAIDPILARHGLSYRFRTRQDERINVTCILSHRDGHSEENTLSGPPDKTGSKNDIQAVGSTLTYLQRYSLTQALGLAADEDDDGRAAGNGAISHEQVEKIKKLTEAYDSDAIAGLLKYLAAESIEAIPAANYDKAIYAIGIKKGKATSDAGASS